MAVAANLLDEAGRVVAVVVVVVAVHDGSPTFWYEPPPSVLVQTSSSTVNFVGTRTVLAPLQVVDAVKD